MDGDKKLVHTLLERLSTRVNPPTPSVPVLLPLSSLFCTITRSLELSSMRNDGFPIQWLAMCMICGTNLTLGHRSL